MTEIWQARDYQLKLAEKGLEIIREHGLVYYAMEERTGKSITAMVVCEESTVTKCIIISKKKALEGWEETLKHFPHLVSYTLTNYHSAHKVKGQFDIAILDEPHSYISGYPKRSVIWNAVNKLVYGLPIIYCSATPYAQGPQLLFNQLALSKWSPWASFKDYYAWFKFYAKRDKAGQLKIKYIGPNRTAIDYDEIKTEEILASVEHLFITKTRKELGFKHEPTDKLHYIELDRNIKDIYNTLLDDNVISFTHSRTNRDYTLVCDSQIKLRWALHMLEGGVLKINDEYIDLGNQEKADYTLKVWGDITSLAIMYQYKADEIKLKRLFKNARLLQAQTYAEGVDLSMYKNLVVYSQDFSTAKHTQRRARQASMDRDEEIVVHFLLVKKAISEQVYKTCSVNKRNFVDSVFEREKL